MNFPALVEEEFITPGDLDLFSFADEAEETWAALTRAGLKTPRAGTGGLPGS